MELTRAYKFRIYPDATRQKEIDERLILAQQFYNKILEKSIESYKNGRTKVSMAQFNRFVKEIIQEDKKYLKLYSQTRCEIEYRLLKAYQNFFRRIKEGNKKTGFPRFRSRDGYKSITYPQDNGSFAIEKERKIDMLRVSRIGRMKIELHKSIEGIIKTLTIKKEAGDYYAIFTTTKETEQQKVEDTNPVGIDLGLNSFAAMSDGIKKEKPKFAMKKEKKLAHWQRVIAKKDMVAKKQKRSKYTKNRAKAITHLQEAWSEVTNQSNDFAHKLSDELVNSGYTSFAVEKLNIQNMVKNHNLAQSIQNASWNRFVQMLSYKAESAGMKVIKVDPRNTSKTCNRCGNIQEIGWERTFICEKCEMKMDRDINTAINILKRAREGYSRSNASGDATSTIQQGLQVASVNQEHTLQRTVAEEAPNL